MADRPRRRIPEATVARLPEYLRILSELDDAIEHVSSDQLADLAWDPSVSRLILEFRDDMSEEEASDAPPPINDAPDGPDVLRVSLTVAAALAFAEQSLQLAAAGRPPCPNCGVPLEATGHRCARKAAYLN